jgi:hypothetical protein
MGPRLREDDVVAARRSTSFVLPDTTRYHAICVKPKVK